MRQSVTSRDTARMSAYFSLFAAGMSAYVSFVTLWQHAIGYSDMRIGALSAASALVAVVAQPWLSALADRSRTKNRVLRFMLLTQAAAAFLHMIPGHWAYVLAVMCLLTAFQSAALALSNAVILDSLEARGQPGRFGFIRLSYSWGFAAAGLVAGWVASIGPALVFALCGGINLAAFAASFLLPEVPGYQRESGKKLGLRALFQYREFMGLTLYSLAVHITNSLSVAFLPVWFGILGAPGWAYGIGIFVMAAAETPFLLVSGRLIERFGIRKLMLVPAAAFTLRWLLTSMVTAWWQLLPLYALHSAGVIVLYVGLSRYVADFLPRELSASGQGAVNSLVISASRVAGALLGGVLITWLGMRETFLVMAGVAAAAGVGLAVFRKEGNVDNPPT